MRASSGLVGGLVLFFWSRGEGEHGEDDERGAADEGERRHDARDERGGERGGDDGGRLGVEVDEVAGVLERHGDQDTVERLERNHQPDEGPEKNPKKNPKKEETKSEKDARATQIAHLGERRD